MSLVGFVLAFLKQISKVLPAVIYLNFSFDMDEQRERGGWTANLYRKWQPVAPPQPFL